MLDKIFNLTKDKTTSQKPTTTSTTTTPTTSSSTTASTKVFPAILPGFQFPVTTLKSVSASNLIHTQTPSMETYETTKPATYKPRTFTSNYLFLHEFNVSFNFSITSINSENYRLIIAENFQ